MKHFIMGMFAALFLLVACGASAVPVAPVNITPQVRDSEEFTSNTAVLWTSGDHAIVTTIYDDPSTPQNGDVLCQSVIGSRGYTTSASTSSAVSCVTLKGETP